VFEVPVTLALKSWVPTVGTEALVGLMLNKTATAATIVKLAEADLVGSATLVAFTLIAAGEGTLAGATNSPFVEIVPHAAPLHPAPLTLQVTPVLEFPVTFAANCWAPPAVTVVLLGFTVMTTTGTAFTVSVAALLVTFPTELLTTTVNCDPLSAAVVTGVV
jgi:hypothetical protein